MGKSVNDSSVEEVGYVSVPQIPVSFDENRRALLSGRLGEVVARLFRQLNPPQFEGSPSARWSQVRLATSVAFGKAMTRRWLLKNGRRRTQSRVRSEYERRWALQPWSNRPSFEKLTEYESRLYVVNQLEPFGNWFFVMALAEIISLLKPKRVLEVGCGNGFNTNSLSLLFPECEFVGLDLTMAGVMTARRLRSDEAFVRQIRSHYASSGYCDERGDRIAPARWVNGDATALPFPDASFDLVITVLAVEQMRPVAERAFREMARVTRALSAHIEPFSDFNRSPFRRMHLTHKDYFRSSTRLLTACGLRPVFSWGGFPRKMHYASGLVVAQKSGRL